MSINEKGITLVSLVITIIVMLILAGVSLSMVMGDTSVLKQASRATISKRLSEIKEEYEVQALGHTIEAKVNRTESKNASACVMGDDLEEFIPSIDAEYIDKLAIYNGELVFLDEGATEEEKQIAAELGYITMSNDDYLYMSNMYRLEEYLLAHKNDASLPGTKMGGAGGASPIEISGIVYGDSWYRIDATNLVALGFTEEEAATDSFGKYAPFVARFDSGEVLSDPGKEMYSNTSRVKHIHTFNYKGEADGIVVSDLLAGVDRSSEKSATKFGAFTAANSKFNYDTDGGLIFTENGDIGELGLDQNVHINQEYSINITVKCDVDQTGESSTGVFPSGVSGKHHRSMIAISDNANQYVCWMGVDGGILRAYNFRCIIHEDGWNSNPSGYLWCDVREYDDKIMNIQLTCKKGGEAKLYINGELKASGTAGNYEYSYKTLTIGDLRKGRKLKFIGNMYNVSIYGRELTETEVLKNYVAIKKDLGL